MSVSGQAAQRAVPDAMPGCVGVDNAAITEATANKSPRTHARQSRQRLQPLKTSDVEADGVE